MEYHVAHSRSSLHEFEKLAVSDEVTLRCCVRPAGLVRLPQVPELITAGCRHSLKVPSVRIRAQTSGLVLQATNPNQRSIAFKASPQQANVEVAQRIISYFQRE